MTPRMWTALVMMITATLSLVVGPQRAEAFCGFYVSGGDEPLYNDATQVALMRHGTRTVLSMRNTYRGPTKDFAMVVPVPEVLQQEQVKTLEDAVFNHLASFTAPRLVEYYERNPCQNSPRLHDVLLCGSMAAKDLLCPALDGPQ